VSLVEKALKKMESARAASKRDIPPPLPPVQPYSPPPVSVAATPAAVALAPVARTDKVVTVHLSALRSSGHLPAEVDVRRLAAEYRHIKRPLMAVAKGRGVPPVDNGRVIMVASALPGEGKTFTSINLAMSIALEKDTSVLLADGDFAKSHLSRIFGVESERGMLDLLLDESLDPAEAILNTSVPGLSLLPAGRHTDTITELIGSARMERIIVEVLARDPKRVVVFDSPPLLLTTESRALAGVAGQIVVVVRAESTQHKAVADALALLGDGKSIGMILNQCHSGATHGYYGYGEYGAPVSDPDRS
jgi:protein-tyrosine kinase